MSEAPVYASISRAVEARSLVPRGAFHPVSEDDVPAMADGRAVGTLVLVGVVGRSTWDGFQAAAESRESPDALDRWSRRVVGELAHELTRIAAGGVDRTHPRRGLQQQSNDAQCRAFRTVIFQLQA